MQLEEWEKLIDQKRLPETHTVALVNGAWQSQSPDLPPELQLQGTHLILMEQTKLITPLHILLLPQLQDTQYCITVGQGSRLILLEELFSPETAQPHQLKLRLELAPQSELIYHRLRFASTAAHCQIHTEIIQHSASTLIQTISGARITNLQEDQTISLRGDNSSLEINEINFTTQEQRWRQQLLIEHAAPGCSSKIKFKGVVQDRGRSGFTGRIVVRSAATGTQAHMENHHLMLSDTAIVDSAPELEIYADEVDCTHGSTVGQLDADALFYLRSRGISHSAAIQLLIAAFVQEISELLPNYPRLQTAWRTTP